MPSSKDALEIALNNWAVQLDAVRELCPAWLSTLALQPSMIANLRAADHTVTLPINEDLALREADQFAIAVAELTRRIGLYQAEKTAYDTLSRS